MKRIALNYIYLSKNHAGGKDQVGLNLLKGFYELGYSKEMCVFCFEYSIDVVRKIAPDIKIIPIKYKMPINNELGRMSYICWINSTIIPKLIKKYSIDLIYHLSCNNGLKKLKCKSVVIPHDIKAVSHRVLANVKIPFYKYWMYRIMYYVDFKHADKIIAISDVDKKEIGTYYKKFKNKIYRIYNPINIDIKERNLEKVQKNIVALNLQFHHKNIITLIKAFERIKDYCDYNLILIGNVPERVNYLKEYVAEHHLEDRVKFTGFVSDEVRDQLFLECSLYVNPTLYEGFGMTAVEAMILKIPTLISKIETNYEITKGMCEYYYPPEDDKVLADRILQCIDQKYLIDIYNQTSQRMIEAYDYKKISQKYYMFFMGVIKDNGIN